MGNVVRGQILHTEDFNLILDTTKAIKGNLIPSRMASSSQLIYNIRPLGKA
jgi:hypothetical protein